MLAEIITKSKMHKAEKAKEKDEELQALENLDSEWMSLFQMPSFVRLVRRPGVW